MLSKSHIHIQPQKQMPHYAVVVLGDLGRSPRMQYHCTSLAKISGATIDFIGYGGERCIDEIENNENISLRYLSTPFAHFPRALFLFWAPFKVLFQVYDHI